MLALARDGHHYRYKREADGCEVLEPFTLTDGEAGMPIASYEQKNLVTQFQRRIDHAKRRA
jgi:hypothetical protein